MKIFAQAFSLFWQNPKFRDRIRDLLLPQTRMQGAEEEKEELAKRIQDTLSTPENSKSRIVEEETLLIDTTGTASDTQLFKEKDFDLNFCVALGLQKVRKTFINEVNYAANIHRELIEANNSLFAQIRRAVKAMNDA